jgi:hypothetical protein
LVADGDYVVVFQSVHRVMKAEKLLKGKGLAVLLIPAPRSISSDCGLALRYGADIREKVETTLADASLLPEDRYLKDGEYKKV